MQSPYAKHTENGKAPHLADTAITSGGRHAGAAAELIDALCGKPDTVRIDAIIGTVKPGQWRAFGRALANELPHVTGRFGEGGAAILAKDLAVHLDERMKADGGSIDERARILRFTGAALPFLELGLMHPKQTADVAKALGTFLRMEKSGTYPLLERRDACLMLGKRLASPHARDALTPSNPAAYPAGTEKFALEVLMSGLTHPAPAIAIGTIVQLLGAQDAARAAGSPSSTSLDTAIARCFAKHTGILAREAFADGAESTAAATALSRTVAALGSEAARLAARVISEKIAANPDSGRIAGIFGPGGYAVPLMRELLPRVGHFGPEVAWAARMAEVSPAAANLAVERLVKAGANEIPALLSVLGPRPDSAPGGRDALLGESRIAAVRRLFDGQQTPSSGDSGRTAVTDLPAIRCFYAPPTGDAPSTSVDAHGLETVLRAYEPHVASLLRSAHRENPMSAVSEAQRLLDNAPTGAARLSAARILTKTIFEPELPNDAEGTRRLIVTHWIDRIEKLLRRGDAECARAMIEAFDERMDRYGLKNAGFITVAPSGASLEGAWIVSAPSKGTGDHVLRCLDRLDELEADCPRSARVLVDKAGLRVFGRYSVELLIKQSDLWSGASLGRHNRNHLLVSNPLADPGGRYADANDITSALEMMGSSKIPLLVTESDSREDLAVRIGNTFEAFGRTRLLWIRGGEQLRSPRDSGNRAARISSNHRDALSARSLKAVLSNRTTVILDGPSLGSDRELGDLISAGARAAKSDCTIYGPVSDESLEGLTLTLRGGHVTNISATFGNEAGRTVVRTTE